MYHRLLNANTDIVPNEVAVSSHFFFRRLSHHEHKQRLSRPYVRDIFTSHKSYRTFLPFLNDTVESKWVVK